ncbi:MAG: hypothetical protein KDB24_13810 [Microthrixaceae bacterium]|nr:hypothetical protein [Microthrixaceae bacterium]
MSTPAVPTPQPRAAEAGGDNRSVAVVIPMPNDPPWELFDHIPADVPIIVSDDSNGNLTPPKRDNVFFYDYAAQEAYAGPHYAAMPHKSAASRNIGHYIAYREGFDVIVALDYDCGTREGWLESHLAGIDKVVDAPAVRPVLDNGWVNSIDTPGFYSRGYPYEFRTADRAAVTETTATGEVKLNMGVWDGILDLNGIDKLQGGEPGDPMLTSDVNRIALGNIPVCGMNTAFNAEITPAYFFLPDLWIDGWQLSRHDDIWGGYVVKKLMDLRGDLFAYGDPVVAHTKQTALERVVVLEQWMHLMSMGFYDLVDAAAAEVGPGSYADMYAHLVEELNRGISVSTLPSHYLWTYGQLADWMGRWSRAFQ